MYETLSYQQNEGVGTLTLNRPQRLNALDLEMVDELRTLLARLADDATLRVLTVTGAGRAFSAGADISALQTLDDVDAPYRFLADIQRAFNDLEALTVPTIAAINGVALGGGCELALACDFRLIAASARIGVPEIKLGVLPGAGGTQRLARLLPPAIAKEMVYLGEPLTAARACEHALVNAVVDDERLDEEVERWALRLRELAPIALRTAKTLLHGGALRGLSNDIEAERQAVAYLFQTEDAKEGIAAFLDKRTPKFTGR